VTNATFASQRLMSSLTIEDLTSSILDFQANMVRLCYRQKTTLVEPAAEPAQAATLDAVWRAARLAEAPDPAAAVDAEGASIVMLKWRRLGYDSEDLGREFGSVGLLGLHCLVRGYSIAI
jgi:engulfment/cell motility protein 1